VLESVGIDKDAGKLWQDFIEFIKSGPGTLGKQDWQSQSKMDLLRKAYQDAISIPTQAVETLWKDYSNFENGLNKMTVRVPLSCSIVLIV
jgi:cleavage stimulation factor subunit 3